MDNWTAQLAQLLTFLWAGNVVGPAAVGVMSIVLIAMSFAHQLLVDSLSEPLVQRARIDPQHTATAFWSLGLLGFAAALVTIALARPVALLFGERVLEPALQVLALCFPLVGPGSTMEATLQRDLRFHVLALRSLAVYAVASPACIVMAYAGFGVWSLVLYQVLIRVVNFLALTVALRRLPPPRLSRRHFDEIWSYGRHNLTSRLVDFASMNMERVIIGYFLGPTSLGLFSLARRIVDSVTWALSGVMSRVALAVLSRAQEMPDAHARLVRRFASLAALVILPSFLGLAAVAPHLVEALLRPQWWPMIPLVQILCLHGLVLAESYLCVTILRSLGRIDLVFRVSVVVTVAKLAIYLLVVRFGGEAIAWALVAISATALPLHYTMVSSRLPDVGGTRLRAYAAPALAATAMAGVVLALGHWASGMAPLPRLVLLVGCGFVAYWVLLGVLRPRSAASAVLMLRARLAGAPFLKVPPR